MILRVTFFFFLLLVTYLSLTPKYTIDIGNDKVGHVIAYTTLAINSGLIYYKKNNKSYWISLILLCIYGGLLEIGQYFVPGRNLSIADIGANAIGIFSGMLILMLFYKPINDLLKASHIIR